MGEPVVTPSLFEDLDDDQAHDSTDIVYGNAERIPLEVPPRPELLAELEALSAACVTWHAKTRDLAWLEFTTRVCLALEQVRVHLGAREP